MTKLFTINLPVADNDGILFIGLDDQTKRDALEQFGGYSYNPVPIEGAWKDESTGQVYIEAMRQISIATEHTSDLMDFAIMLNKRYKQECMFVVCGSEVHFVK